MRGFSCIALDNPKFDANVGGALRAAGCYGAAMVVVGGGRFTHEVTDTMKAYRHIPTVKARDVMAVVPHDCVPVAVDLIPGATPLYEYEHPERAYYVFGAEDATLGRRIIERCRDVVYVPTYNCMNLAATVNVVMYDRNAKRGEWPA